MKSGESKKDTPLDFPILLVGETALKADHLGTLLYDVFGKVLKKSSAKPFARAHKHLSDVFGKDEALKHQHVALVCAWPTDTLVAFLEKTSLGVSSVLHKSGLNFVIVSGTLAQWKQTFILACRSDGDIGLRLAMKRIYAEFLALGLGQLLDGFKKDFTEGLVME